MMSQPDTEELEEKLRLAGRSLAYPATPSIAAKVATRLNRPVQSRRPRRERAGAVLLILILALTLILATPARAAILNFIQIGVVRIFRTQPTTVPPQKLGEQPTAPTLLPSVLDLAGETTLSDAQSNLDFPILLPAYPTDLGRPAHVYLQDAGGPMLVLVWMDPAHPDQARLSLDEIAPGSWAIAKSNPRVVEETSVNGQRAVWVEGPYLLQISNSNYELKQLVTGYVLIWAQGNLTYRLETDLGLEEAVKIAESLGPIH